MTDIDQLNQRLLVVLGLSPETAQIVMNRIVEAERQKAEIEREFNALNKKFSMVLTDESYVGGVRYWVAKHDKLLLDYQNLLIERAGATTTPPAPPPPTD